MSSNADHPLQKAIDEYRAMNDQLDEARAECQRLAIENGSLHAETSMLRESLDRADADRIRLQAISSTLLGRLLAINDTISGAVRASIKDGIDATKPTEADKALDEAGEEAQEIIQRLPQGVAVLMSAKVRELAKLTARHQ